MDSTDKPQTTKAAPTEDLDSETKNKLVASFLAFAFVLFVAAQVFFAEKQERKPEIGPVKGRKMLADEPETPPVKVQAASTETKAEEVPQPKAASADSASQQNDAPLVIVADTGSGTSPVVKLPSVQEPEDAQEQESTEKASPVDDSAQMLPVENPPKRLETPTEAKPDLRDVKAKEEPSLEVERRDGETFVTIPDVPQAPSQGFVSGKTGTKTKHGAIILGFDVLTSFEYVSQPPGIPSDKLPKQLPVDVLKYDGKRVQVSGFMLPIDVEDDGHVSLFFLMRDLASCCFGGAPKMNEWVLIEVTEGFKTKYTGYAPISVYGNIEIGEKIEYGRVTSVYRLKAEKLEKH